MSRIFRKERPRSLTPGVLLLEARNLLRFIKSRQQLAEFNARSNNRISSLDVNLKAIIGHDIAILNGTYVCENSTIDSYCYIGPNSNISKTTIGRYNSIAGNVNIGHGEHPIDQISTSAVFMDSSYELFTKEDCIIEHDVWIGVGAIIRRGVRLGIGSVIGANSFVNRDVPPYAIVVGSPAKVLKFRFEEKKIKRILESKWWEYDSQEAQVIINDLAQSGI
jgi:acetyltransferase-like isoleucine patch superfamily enzyme